MRTQTATIKGDAVSVHYYEGTADRDAFYDWLGRDRVALAFDTETTGLDIYSRGFACRLAQFGDHHTSWVLPGRYVPEIRYAIEQAPRLVCHNSSHDLHVADKHYGMLLEDVHPKTLDTFLLSHIIDPRSELDGGVGHGLKNLATFYVDTDAADGDKLLKQVFKDNKWTGDTGWCEIPEDNETFVLYSGLDTILTSRLLEKLLPLAKPFAELVAFEHKLQLVTAKMERRGILLDVEYAENLQAKLLEEEERHNEAIVALTRELGTCPITKTGMKYVMQMLGAAMHGTPVPGPPKHPVYGPVSAGSNKRMVLSFLAMGETLTETTDTGALSVGKDVLLKLCDINADEEPLETREPNKLAEHVRAAKRASKWKSSYVDTMLETRDENDRVHPKISSLKARTGRMAISRPPLQQLPSSGRMIRDCFIPDPGFELVSCDKDQVEMKILAGLTKDDTMVQVMADGVDIFDFTAEKIYGKDFTKKQRKALKAAGYGTCYGGGPATISKQTGLTVPQAKKVQGEYLDTFPGIRTYSQHLQLLAKEDPDLALYNDFGRKLPLDEDRIYSALNYMIQSSARDDFARALVELDGTAMGDLMLLPIHDEILAQAPIGKAKQAVLMLEKYMTTEFGGVALTSGGEVIGDRWGNAYGAAGSFSSWASTDED